jgi:hypothetical protein
MHPLLNLSGEAVRVVIFSIKVVCFSVVLQLAFYLQESGLVFLAASFALYTPIYYLIVPEFAH